MLHSVAVTGAEPCKAGKLAADVHSGHQSEDESQRNEKSDAAIDFLFPNVADEST